MKKLLGIIVFSSLVSTNALAGNSKKADQAPQAERKVVRVVVKDQTTQAKYVKSKNPYLVRTYGAQTAAAKVYRPDLKKGNMPNLYKN